MRAAKGRRMRGVVTPCGLRLASVVNYNENRQCRQRLVKRRTGKARTVWAAERRRCQFKRYNRQCEQQKVTRSTAECGAAWVAKSECCQFQKCDEAVEGFIKIRGKIYQFNSRSELENLKIY